MYEDFAWEQFLITGNVETFMEYKKMLALSRNSIYEKKGEIANETCKGEGDCNKGSCI
ncbi:MAG: hypothetical protein J6A15_02455 [Clostridia bacterium]|nr:hypothetical protein [Clostridia bacterium]